MGNTKSQQSEPVNSGTVVNEIEIQQSEITNQDLIWLLYIISITHLIKFFITMYKLWKNNLKKKYIQRSATLENLSA